MAGIVLAIVLVFAHQMRSFNPSQSPANGEIIDQLGRSALIFIYLSMLFAFLVPHRLLQNNNALGLVSIITLITSTKARRLLRQLRRQTLRHRQTRAKTKPRKNSPRSGRRVHWRMRWHCDCNLHRGTSDFIHRGCQTLVVVPGLRHFSHRRPAWWAISLNHLSNAILKPKIPAAGYRD